MIKFDVVGCKSSTSAHGVFSLSEEWVICACQKTEWGHLYMIKTQRWLTPTYDQSGKKISVLTYEKKIVVQIFKNSHSPRQLGRECETEGSRGGGETGVARAYKVRWPQSGQSQSSQISKETIQGKLKKKQEL